MKLEDRIRLAVNRRTSNVILRADVARLGGASQVSVALNRLQKKGMLIRIGKGVYAKASYDSTSGTIMPVQSLETLATEALRRLGVNSEVESASLLNVQDESTAPSDAVIKIMGPRRISRKLFVGDRSVTYVCDHAHAKRSKNVVAGDASDGSLEIPKIGLKKYVIDLAKRYKVTYVKTYSDQWAESVTRLAGDEVRTDSIEHLVIALKKAHKVSSTEMVQMLANYLREKERV